MCEALNSIISNEKKHPKIASVGKDMGNRELLCTVGGNVK
jgi:hypothetical protein